MDYHIFGASQLRRLHRVYYMQWGYGGNIRIYAAPMNERVSAFSKRYKTKAHTVFKVQGSRFKAQGS